jgi:hypothetical protein
MIFYSKLKSEKNFSNITILKINLKYILYLLNYCFNFNFLEVYYYLPFIYYRLVLFFFIKF